MKIKFIKQLCKPIFADIILAENFIFKLQQCFLLFLKFGVNLPQIHLHVLFYWHGGFLCCFLLKKIMTFYSVLYN